jgi:4-diphosphocytidyl-2-C-methyl-D-erythritol kinase
MQDFQTFPAPAKINLFLHVTGQRPDGYHLLQSVFQLLDIVDYIHLKPTLNGEITRSNEVEGVPADEDLCIKAAKCLQAHALTMHQHFDHGVEIQVTKNIPMGGGLGGGSSDAATVLLALNKLWSLNLSRETLMALGLTLGADVPFFIFGQNAWVEGIGEKLQPITLHPNHYVVLNPQIHVSTKQIFTNKQLTKNTIPKTMSNFSGTGNKKERFNGEPNVKTDFINDLEKIVCNAYPAVHKTLNWLNQFGDARMTGSGASVFVEVANEQDAVKVLDQKPNDITGFVTKGLNQHPLYDFCF